MQMKILKITNTYYIKMYLLLILSSDHLGFITYQYASMQTSIRNNSVMSYLFSDLSIHIFKIIFLHNMQQHATLLQIKVESSHLQFTQRF